MSAITGVSLLAMLFGLAVGALMATAFSKRRKSNLESAGKENQEVKDQLDKDLRGKFDLLYRDLSRGPSVQLEMSGGQFTLSYDEEHQMRMTDKDVEARDATLRYFSNRLKNRDFSKVVYYH